MLHHHFFSLGMLLDQQAAYDKYLRFWMDVVYPILEEEENQ